MEEQTETQFISCTSYNILADLYADQKYFEYCEHEHLQFGQRSHLIVEELKKLNSDIVCIQEVDHFKQFYKSAFESIGYDCYYLPKPIREEGILILLKKNKFKVISSEQLIFDTLTPMKLSKEHYKKNNSCQILNIVHLESATKIILANTHLFWNPSNEEIKLLQAALIMEKLGKLANHDSNVILCGDFNSLPSSNVVQLITQHLEPSLERIEEMFKQKVRLNDLKYIYKKYADTFRIQLKSAYENYLGKGVHPQFTNFTSKFKGNLDYIFYNAQMKDLEFKQVTELPIDKITKEKGLPSYGFPSDHIPITATFRINKQEMNRQKQVTPQVESNINQELIKQ